jgi:hypothetical protein
VVLLKQNFKKIQQVRIYSGGVDFNKKNPFVDCDKLALSPLRLDKHLVNHNPWDHEPWRYKKINAFRDVGIQQWLWELKKAQELYEDYKAQVIGLINKGTYAKSDIAIVILCSNGKQRSVIFVERLFRDLTAQFPNLEISRHHPHVALGGWKSPPNLVWQYLAPTAEWRIANASDKIEEAFQQFMQTLDNTRFEIDGFLYDFGQGVRIKKELGYFSERIRCVILEKNK